MRFHSDTIEKIEAKVKGSGTDIEKAIISLREFQKSYRSGEGDVIGGLMVMDGKEDKILDMAREQGMI